MPEKTKDDSAIAMLVRSRSARPVPWGGAILRHHRQFPSHVKWSRDVTRHTKNFRIVEWYVECTLAGEKLLTDSVDVDPNRRGGRAVIKGTGFTVAQVLIEIAGSSGPEEVAENFNLDHKLVVDFLNGLAMLLSKPFGK